MLERIGSRELVEWFAFLELEREAIERLREEAQGDADTGPQTLGADPNDPLGIGRAAPGPVIGGLS